jgi:magnesium chelatase family protein
MGRGPRSLAPFPATTYPKNSMLARVKSGALKGVDAYIVEVEVDLAPGLPAFTTVGLPETAVKEAKDRVRAALKNSGYQFPGNRITTILI